MERGRTKHLYTCTQLWGLCPTLGKSRAPSPPLPRGQTPEGTKSENEPCPEDGHGPGAPRGLWHGTYPDRPALRSLPGPLRPPALGRTRSSLTPVTLGAAGLSPQRLSRSTAIAYAARVQRQEPFWGDPSPPPQTPPKRRLKAQGRGLQLPGRWPPAARAPGWCGHPLLCLPPAPVGLPLPAAAAHCPAGPTPAPGPAHSPGASAAAPAAG